VQLLSDILREQATLPAVGSPATQAELRVELGEALLQCGQPMAAVDALQRASDLMPDSAAIWLSLARAQIQAADLSGAEQSLARSTELSPGDSRCYVLLGYLRLCEHRPAEAREAFGQAQKLDPADSIGKSAAAAIDLRE
jgi:Flp pilus assembly protein TadD